MELVKMVLRFNDGRLIKGYSQDFFPNKPSFHLYPVQPEASKEATEISIKDLKGVFFVRDFEGDREYQEQKGFSADLKIVGRRVEVTFKDGEVMIGTTLGYDAQRPGFFFFPCDQNANNLRVFVVSQAVKKVRYI